MSDARTSQRTKQMVAFMIISVSCFIAIGICSIVNFSISGGFTWSLYPILSIIFVWLLSTPLLTKSSSFVKWLLPPTIFMLPYLALLGRVTPITGWLMGLAVPITFLGIAALWICFFVSKRLKSNSWYLAAALIFIIGSVFSPMTTLLSVNFASVEFLLSDYVTTLIGLVVFISMFSSLMVAGTLFGVGYTKRNVYISK